MLELQGRGKPTPKLSVIPKMKPTKNFKENKEYIAFFKEINKIKQKTYIPRYFLMLLIKIYLQNI